MDSESRNKVLIVEDDKTLRRATVELFKALGYETVTAEDGVAALSILEAEPSINFLFTDVVMPKGVNGVELIEKARDLRPDIKALLASGYPFEKIDTHGVIDESSFISKPYRTAQLMEKLEGLQYSPN
jgi:CheY-like chemotaxis protein